MPSPGDGSTQQACHPPRSPRPEGPLPPPAAAAGKQGRAMGPGAAAAAGPDRGANLPKRGQEGLGDSVLDGEEEEEAEEQMSVDEEEEEEPLVVKRRRKL